MIEYARFLDNCRKIGYIYNMLCIKSIISAVSRRTYGSMKKNCIYFSVIVAIIVLLAACGINQSDPTSNTTSAPLNDEAFIQNMQNGLENRWAISNNEPDTFNSSFEKKESYKKCVNAELDAIGDLSTYVFSDAVLKDLAKQYYDALQKQLEGIMYIGTDESKFQQIYGVEGYYNRARVIYRMVDAFGLTTSSEYAELLDEFVSIGRVLLEVDDETAQLNSIFNDSTVLESNGGTNYDFIITNNTEYDLSDARIEFVFYDDKNVIVDNATEYMNTWRQGSTKQVSVYVKKEFVRVEARVSIWNNSLNDYLVSEYHQIQYVNNMTIEIKITSSLPCDISDISSNWVMRTCSVQSFDYEVKNWSNRKASVSIKLSGSKTYDIKGDSYSCGVHIGWKLYDEKGNVVDSGTIRSSDVKVGETFTDASDTLYKLEPGSYTIELLNVSK